MSLHRSLKSLSTMKRHRSVLSRLERVKILEERGILDLEKSSLTGLPKVKHLKIRVRKEKAAVAAPQAAEAAASAGGGVAAPSAGAKPAATGKPAAKAPPGAKGAVSPPKQEAGAPQKKKE